MPWRLKWLAVFVAFVTPSALANEVGFSIVSVPDLPQEPLQVGIWYPTKASASEQRLDLFTQIVAPDAAVDGSSHPLIVISHGSGGSLAGHYDTALALAHAGFVVAAMTHTGDNYKDQSRATQLVDRPRSVHAVIGYMLKTWTGRSAIDPAKIGMFGFSSGGFTTLVSVGGVPDLQKIMPYCASHAESYVCQLLTAHATTDVRHVQDASWIADPRIKAAVIAAPALGFTFTRSGLKDVLIPIQLWRAEDDHVLPAPDYAEAVRDALPRPPDYHVIPGADHFDFLAPCTEALADAAPVICQERGGFNRTAFHQAFNQDVVRFFEHALHP